MPEFTAIAAEPSEDLRLSAALGFANVPENEPTGTAEHAPLVFRYRGEMVPSLVLESLMLWHGVTPDEVEVTLGSQVRLGDKLSIPVNQAGAMMVDWSQPFYRAGFDDLELAVDQLEKKLTPVIPLEKLKDRLVILARTDGPSRTLRLPTGRMGSDGDLFAAALATAEAQAFARPSGWWGNGAVLLLGVLLAVALHGKSRFWAPLLSLGFVAAYLLACLAVFESARVALPLSPMLGLTAFVFLHRMLSPASSRPRPAGPGAAAADGAVKA